MARKQTAKKPLVIIAVALVVLILAFTLNYLFNLFPLPFLQPKVSLFCPVPKDACNKGKIIIANGKVIGIGFALPPGTPLSASLEGTAQLGVVQNVKTKESHPIVWFYGKDNLKDYVLTYSFYGTPLITNTSPSSKESIKEKSYVGYIGFGNFSKEAPYGGANLVFSVKKGDKITSQPLPLEKIEFK